LNTAPKKTIKTLIVDDEALARRGLKLRLKPFADIEIVAEARNGKEAVRKIEELGPDLVFLDIQMPGMSGFEVIAALDETRLPAFLFVTAYDEYAIRAFEVNAADYLLKPIEDQRLETAVKKVRRRLASKRVKAQHGMLLKLLSEITGKELNSIADIRDQGIHKLKRKEAPRLAIRDGGKTTWVKEEDIEWIDAAGDYMCVHALGETHIMRKTMKQLEQELVSDFLQRIHRSTIVNIRHIREMQSHINGEYFLTLKGGHTVKLSRTYKDKLRHLQ
jgi:two-component system LytT family response regulator